MTREDLIEEVERLRADGWDSWEILRALGTKPSALAKRLERAGRRDLALPFEQLESRRPWRPAA